MIELDVLATAPARHVFTAGEWHRMGELGLFAPDQRLELLSGVVLERAPIGPRHAGCANRLTSLVVVAAGSAAVVAVQNPVRLDERSEPVPDLALCRPPLEAHDDRHPVPADVLLLIEVADSTLAFDLGAKAQAYARAGIPETWVADLTGARLVVLTDPGADGYRSRRDVRAGEVVAPLGLPRCVVAVSEVLPPAR